MQSVYLAQKWKTIIKYWNTYQMKKYKKIHNFELSFANALSIMLLKWLNNNKKYKYTALTIRQELF